MAPECSLWWLLICMICDTNASGIHIFLIRGTIFFLNMIIKEKQKQKQKMAPLSKLETIFPQSSLVEPFWHHFLSVYWLPNPDQSWSLLLFIGTFHCFQSLLKSLAVLFVL